jgi:glutathione S-transferase
VSGRALLFTTGSPFARAVRIVLHELGLDYERREELTTPTVEARAAATPTLQVPTLWDGDLTLWESGVIAEYLVTTYRAPDGASPPLARRLARKATEWRDRRLFASVQTLGTAVTTISQMTWTGVPVGANAHLGRAADRCEHILDWLEGELPATGEGFFPGELSLADIFLECHLGFAEKRPIGLDLDLARRPRIAALRGALASRPSFAAVPVWWWDPSVTGYAPDGTPVHRR